MSPTAAGTAFVARARRMLIELERAQSEVQPAGAVTGIVAVGLLNSVEQLLAAPLVEVVRRKHPGIELHLAAAYSGHLQRWLDDGELDISLLYNLATTQSIRFLPVLRDRLWAVAPANAGLSANSPVTLDDLLRRPFVMPTAGHHGIRILLDEARLTSMVQPNVIAHTNSMTLQTRLVEAGQGWTLLPAAGVSSEVAAGKLSAAPLTDPEIIRTVGLGRSRNGGKSPAVDVVAAELLALVQAAVRSQQWVSAELCTD